MWIFYKIANFFHYIPKRIKWFFQRGIRGYSDIDVWDISYWFENTIIPMLKQLKKGKHGYPMGMTEKEWDMILDNMICYFEESTKKYCSEKNEYEEEYTKDLLNDNEEFNKSVRNRWLKREEEISRYRINMKNKALKLFSKYYYDLWD